MKRTWFERVGDFVLGKGFYIVLFLCVATIGISGYYLMRSVTGNENELTPVTGTPSITLPDSSQTEPTVTIPIKPTVTKPDASTETKTPEVPAEEVTQPDDPEPVAQTKTFPAVYTWPVKGEVLQTFSVETLAYDPTMDDWRTHAGVDISSPIGTEVMSMRGGIVDAVLEDDLMGTTVVINHGEGMVSAYSNLAGVPVVAAGDEVSTGTVIGAVGETALAESAELPHVHVELLIDNVPVDPTEYLPEK